MKFLAVALVLTMSFSAFSQQLNYRKAAEEGRNVFRIVRMDTVPAPYGPVFAFSKGGTRKEVNDTDADVKTLSKIAICNPWTGPEPLLRVDAKDLTKDIAISLDSCEVLVKCLKTIDQTEVIVVKLDSGLNSVEQIELPAQCKPLPIQ